MGQPILKALTPDQLTALSPQLRKAARYVVEHPDEVATRSQRHVASAANLSAPTLTRLAQAIGYESYDALRDVCRDEMLSKRTILSDKARRMLEPGAGEPAFAIRHAGAAVRNIEAFIESLDLAELEAAVSLLARARHVGLIGFMSGRPTVEYAAYVANISLGGWRVLGRAGDALACDLAELGPGDACIVFSVQPYGARAIELAGHVVDRQVPLIALTDNPLSPVAALAQHTFLIGTQSPQFFPSHLGAMLFFETTIGMVIQNRGERAQQKITAIERQNHKLGEYWQD